MKVYVSCIVKLEGRYLREFCDHYFLLGFDGIRLYDNNEYSNPMSELETSDAEIMKSLSTEYGDKVVVFPFPGKCMQSNAYTHTIYALCDDLENWCAMFDADEFLVLKKHANIKDFITETRELDSKCGSIGINWVMFDNNDLETYEPGRIVDRFTRRMVGVDNYIKSIVHCCRVSQTPKIFLRNRVGFNSDPHFAYLIDGYKNISPEGGEIFMSQYIEGSDKIATLHHYFTKSKEEYLIKMARGKADRTGLRSEEEMDMPGEKIQDTCAQHPVFIELPEPETQEAEALPEASETDTTQEVEEKAQKSEILPPSPTSVDATASAEHVAQLALDIM